MAVARICHRWPDGTETDCEIHVDPSFPDAIDEARSAVLRLWRETCTEADTEAEPES